MNRRGFLQGILAASVAPAFVGSKVLMPVRSIVVPEVSGNSIFMASGNSLLTIDQITIPALRRLEKHMRTLNLRLEQECFESFKGNQIIRIGNG